VPRAVLSSAFSSSLFATAQPLSDDLDIATVRFILGRPECDIWALNSNRSSPLHMAISNRHFNIVAELVNQNLKVVADHIDEWNGVLPLLFPGKRTLHPFAGPL
jgi:ankyrin repeat protein